MRNAVSFTLVLMGTGLLAACQDNVDPPENVAASPLDIENGVVDVDTLPADESSTTPSNELTNGVAEPVENSSGY